MKSNFARPAALFLAILLIPGWAAAQMTSSPTSGAETFRQAPVGSVGAGTSAGQVAAQALQQQANAQNPFLGSVPEGKASGEVLQLTLKDAIDRALRNNLGPILANQSSRSAAAQRWRALADMLPHLAANTGWLREKVNLTLFGLPLPPGTPAVVGPLSVLQSEAQATQNAFDLHAIENIHAKSEDVKAANLNYRDARDVVVLAAAGLYFQVEANTSRVTAAQARLQTAEAVYNQSVDLKKAGVVAGIDVLRSDVERRTEQQRLLAGQNDLAKSKLQLARAIGLPIGQEFEIAENVPYQPAPPITLEMALQTAYNSRADYAAQKAQVRAAEYDQKAAWAQRLPALRFDTSAGYSALSNYSNAKSVYAYGLTLHLPIFEGGRIHGDELAAEAALARRKAQLEDMRGRIDYEVRSSMLDLKSAADQVQVAQEAVRLSQEELAQARDRFAAGVADNLEVTRAQEALANANENLISAIYAHNFAKASLARSMGVAVEAAQKFLGGK